MTGHMTASEHLALLEADATLRFTGARWRAHEAVYPGSGGGEYAERYRERDAAKLVEIDETLAEYERATLGGANGAVTEAIPYLQWLRQEIAA